MPLRKTHSCTKKYILSKVSLLYTTHKVKLIEGNVICRHLKTVTWKRTLLQLFICQKPHLLDFCLGGWSSNFVGPESRQIHMVGLLKMNTALQYSTRVVQEGGRRCKKSTLNDLAYLTPLRIPLMNPVIWRVH